MMDHDKTKDQLIAENEELRRRVAELESLDLGRRRADEELARSKAILTAAIECLPFDFFALDPDGRCILQNAVSRQHYGEALGKMAEQVCPDERVLPRWIEGNRRALGGEKVEEEAAWWVGGEERHFCSFLTPIQDATYLYGVLGFNVDITERKRADKALRQSEGRYRALAESTRDIIFILDRQGTLLYANQAASQCIGIPAGEIVGKRQVDLFPPQMACSQIEKIERVFSTGEVIEYDDLFHFGPAEVWLRIHLIPIRDEAGTITSVMGVCHNITERKQTELALVEREARLREAQEVANLGFYVVDLRTGCCTSSSVLDRIFGISVGYPRTIDGWANLVHPDDRQELLDGFKKAVDEKKPSELEYRIVRYGDKQVRWVHGLGRLQFNEEGQPISMLGTIQDITERKQAEEALRESEERFRLLVEAIPQPVWRSDADGNVIEFNRRWHEYTGQTAEEAKGSGWTKALHSDEAAMVVGKVRGGITSGTAIEIVNRLRRASDGSYRWHLARAVPMNDRGGKTIGWFGCATDIDDQKRAEEALRQSEEALQKAHDKLEQRVKERTAELAKANEELAIFRKFAEASGQGFSMADLDGHLMYLNPTLCRMLGDEGPKDRIGQHLSICYSEASNRRGKQEIEPVLKREGYWQGELPMLSRQGKLIPTWHNAFLIRDDNGSPLHLAVVITDITERKAAAEALRISEEKYRGVAEACPDAIVMSDLSGRVFFASRQTWGLLGLADSDELVGRSVFDFVIASDQKRLAENLSNLLEMRVRRNTEYTALRKDGTAFPAEASSAVIRDATGQPKAVMAVIRDITARKRGEEALRASEERLRLAQQVARVGTFEWNIQTGVNSWTPELEALYGLSPGGFPGTQPAWEKLVYCDDRTEVLRLAERALETGEPVEGEWRVVWPDGSVHWLAGRWQAFKDESGKPLRLIGVNIDITARKQAEESLRASEERYELAVRGAGVGIWDWDIRTGKLYFSPRWRAIFGYDENEIGDSVEDWAGLLHPDEKDWMLKLLEDFLAGTSPTVTVEYRLRHKDGSYRWIVAHGIVLRDEQGKAYRFVGSHGDITDRKRTEEALERERQTLWHMLQASDHERQTISYDIHDGLAQYLAAAGMQLQVFDGLRESNPEAAKKAYDAATQLVSQSHAEARRLVSEVRPPIIDEIGLETAISHLVHEQRRHGGPEIEYHSSVQFGRLPAILENALYRIVQEALTNACKHSKSKNVMVTMTQEGQDVRLEVQDWGIGFDPGSVEKGHFGLEGIRQRVRLLGGRLTIESTPGSGTLVQVVVPIVERQGEK
jgi:PAS domain S-box-containing protein